MQVGRSNHLRELNRHHHLLNSTDAKPKPKPKRNEAGLLEVRMYVGPGRGRGRRGGVHTFRSERREQEKNKRNIEHHIDQLLLWRARVHRNASYFLLCQEHGHKLATTSQNSCCTLVTKKAANRARKSKTLAGDASPFVPQSRRLGPAGTPLSTKNDPLSASPPPPSRLVLSVSPSHLR